MQIDLLAVKRYGVRQVCFAVIIYAVGKFFDEHYLTVDKFEVSVEVEVAVFRAFPANVAQSKFF